MSPVRPATLPGRDVNGGDCDETVQQGSRHFPGCLPSGSVPVAHAEAVAWIKDPKNCPEVLAITRKNVVLGENIPNRDKVYELMVKDAIPHFSAALDRPSVKAWHDFLLENKVLDKPLAVR